MPLIGGAGTPAKVTTDDVVVEGVGTADKASKNDTKKAAEKRLKERRKAQKDAVIAYLQGLPSIPDNIRDIVADWVNPQRNSGPMESLFDKIWGDAPKVGDTRTLTQVVNLTNGKGIDKMNELMGKWKQKGQAVVEYIPNKADVLESQYIIRSLG